MKSLAFLILAVLVIDCTCQNDEQEGSTEFRLPGSVIPTHYDLKYTEVDLKNLTFKGDVKIEAKVVSQTKKIVLHKGKLDANVTALIVNKENIEKLQSNINDTTNFWTIELPKLLNVNDSVTIDIVFDGKLRHDMIGFYWSSYIGSSGKEVFLAATQFEGAHARHAFPCFDEPALKATFNISILPQKGYGCLSNMPHNPQEPKDWCVFRKSVPMSTYLVAFVISDFENKKVGSRVSLWSRPNALYQASYGAEIGNRALGQFEVFLNIDYPLPKMDMVAVPDFSAGAMENWGLLTFRETAALYDPKESSDVAQQRIASVIVHECTHMWFGNLVTPKWWSYLWLSEAFARYYQYMATNKVVSGWHMDEQFVVEQHQLALSVDAEKDSVAMTRPAATQAEIEKMGGTITYSKGASIVRMMELTFGSDVFIAALQEYLKDRSYKSATPDDLWRALQNQADNKKLNINVAKIMKEWTEKPGFPYLSVSVGQDKIKLEQKRFFLRNTNEVPETTWQVPITTLSASGVNDISTKPVSWLTAPTGEIDNKNKNDEWMIFNVNSAGFYRVNYDKESWNKIIIALTEGDFLQIPVLNRAAIVDDLLNLARAEILDYEVALRGIQYLRREKNYLPFKSAFTALDYLTSRFSTTSEDKNFKDFVVSLFSNIYDELSYDDKKNDDRLTILLRQELNQRACKFNQTACISKSKEYFKQWKLSRIPIPVNQRSVAYCTAIKHGNADDWEYLWKEYQNANVAAEQVVILGALGCTKNTTLLESYLLKALTSFKESGIRKQDVSSVFSSVYTSSPEGAEYMLDFVTTQADAINKYHGSYEEIGKLISGALKAYPSKKLIDKLNGILNSNSSYIKGIETTLKKSLELAKLELVWFNKYSQKIIKWISDKAKEEETVAYRLPENVKPSNYKLRLKPHIKENDFTFDGVVEITADVTNVTKKIVLHADQLNAETNDVEVFKINGNTLEKIDIDLVDYEAKYHFILIRLKKSIDNIKILIKIKYTGTLNTEMRGFYRSSYNDKSGKKRWLATTHLEPVGARRVFPCFDEPALKARFDITVETPQGYSAISNTKPKSVSAYNSVYEFETTPVMSTYLVAVVVSDFLPVSTTDRNYAVYSNPLIVQQMNYSLSVMRPTVEFFEANLKYPYELPKLDMVALPDFASGAMENWGLMTFREANLAYDPATMSTVANKQSIRNVIAHEITHQWFGDLVSPLWWDYLWLSEGFARYFQYHAYTEEEATWNLESQFVVEAMQTSFTNDASTGTHPIIAQVYSPTEIRGIFDTISYAKAGSVIRMLEKLVGSKIFFAALHNYLENCKHSTGTPEQLFRAFQVEVVNNRVKLDVIKLMENWTKNEGFPVLNVTFNKDGATFQQSRFYLRPPKSEQKQEPVWMIPLSWATGKNPNFTNTEARAFVNEKSKSLNIDKASDDWIIFNLQQTGYYRVNYDKEMWRRLIGVLNSNHKVIHEINRAALLDDLLNLGRVGYVDYELVLEGARYLRFESEYGPWRAAYNGFNYLEKRFEGRPEFYEAYRTFMLELLESSIKRLGFEDVPNERHTDTLLRKLTLEWMAKLEHDEYVKEALKLFEKEKAVKEFTVPPNKQAYVYNTAIRHGTKEDWDYLYDRMKKSIYATEKLTLLAAIAQSKNPQLLRNILEDVITEDSIIRLQDAKKVITNIIDNGVIGIKTVLDFIESNYEPLQNYLKDDVKSLLSTISKRLSTQELLDQFESVVKKSTESMPKITKSLQSYLKRAKTEMDWSKENGPKILLLLYGINYESNYRLPTFAKPEAYELKFKPYFDQDKGKEFTFEGNAVIDITIVNDTKVLVLHQEKLDIKKTSLSDDASFKILEELTYYDKKTHKLYLTFDQSVKAETKFKLTFEFTGILRDDMRGFYRSYYFDKNGNKKWIASTHFEPTYARRAFPCFDEPSFKANFTVHISRPDNYHSISNRGSTPSQSKRDGKDRYWDIYPESLKMSPYLLAFVVSDFVSVGANNSRVKTWSRADLKDYMQYSSVAGEKSLSILEEFTKIKYPLEEMNFVAVPDFDMGAMENWGLVTYREYGLTYDTQRTSATYKRYVSTVISHELVHQWFGNLVTCDWWDYAWLNEGFAEYVSYIVSNQIENKWDLMEQFVVKELHVGLDVDSLDTSHPMNNNITTPAEAQATFDKIAYQKAASVLRMLHHSIGKAVFEESLHNYLVKHSYRTGKPEFLYQAIKERLSKKNDVVPGNLKENIVTVLESWTTQSGYPVVKAVRKNTTVEISQERFLVTPSNKTEERNKIYWTPITFTTEGSKDFQTTTPQLWLGKEPQQLTVKSTDSWYILNVQEIGFYRVHYDEANWKQLVSVLNSDKYTDIHVLNRAQILDDSLNLARAGYLDYEIALDASKYLTRETSFIAWRAYFNGVAYLAQRVEGNEVVKKLFSRYIVKLLDNNFKKLGFKEDMEKDTQLDQLNRELLATQACKYGHEDCLKGLSTDPNISPNIAGVVYCEAAKQVTGNDWDNIWKAFTETQMATEYLTILRGLGCSKNATTLEKYLNLVFEKDSKVRRQDVATALSSIYTSSQEGLEVSFNYYKSNLDKLHKFYDSWDDVGSLFSSLAGYIVTEEQIKNFENLAKDKSAKEIKTTLEKAVTKAKNNLEWFNQNSPKIQKWLEKFDESENPVTEKPSSEKPTTEKPSSEKPATEKPSSEKPATENPSSEKPATEKPSSEKPATEKPSSEKPATEKPSSEKPATEKPSSEKPATEKPSDGKGSAPMLHSVSMIFTVLLSITIYFLN